MGDKVLVVADHSSPAPSIYILVCVTLYIMQRNVVIM